MSLRGRKESIGTALGEIFRCRSRSDCTSIITVLGASQSGDCLSFSYCIRGEGSALSAVRLSPFVLRPGCKQLKFGVVDKQIY